MTVEKRSRKLLRNTIAAFGMSATLLGMGYSGLFEKPSQVVVAADLKPEDGNTNILNRIRNENIANFVYKADEGGDRWQVSNIGGVRFEGDCEDFALAVARDIYNYNQENGNVFSMGVIVTRSRYRDKFKAHAGLIVYDRQNGKYFLVDNGAYRYGDQKGFIDLGEGERAPYEDFSNLRVNGKPVYDAYMMGLTGDPSTIDLVKYSKGMYWNQIF